MISRTTRRYSRSTTTWSICNRDNNRNILKKFVDLIDSDSLIWQSMKYKWRLVSIVEPPNGLFLSICNWKKWPLARYPTYWLVLNGSNVPGFAEENLAKFHRETWALCDVVAGDEPWFYHKQQTGRKSSNDAWTPIGGTQPTTVARCSCFVPRNLFFIFFKTTGLVLNRHVDRGDTIDRRYIIANCLQPLIAEIRR